MTFLRLATAFCTSALAFACSGKSGSVDDSSGSSSGDGGGATDTNSNKSTAASCAGGAGATATYKSVTLAVNGTDRTYGLAVPSSYSASCKYPLVFVFHGDGGTGAEIRKDFAIEAQALGAAIFVYPDGTNDNNGHSFDQDDDPPKNHDVDFFDAMLTSLEGGYSVDPKAVYITGMSGGAYFVNQLGRWRASEIWGEAPMSGGGPFGNGDSDFSDGNITVNGQVPALIIHGDADGVVDISEGQKSLTYWRGADNCTTGQGAAYVSPCQQQVGCTVPVVWCEIPKMGHTIWTSAPEVVWSFFIALQTARG